jgi:hypothetical protein
VFGVLFNLENYWAFVLLCAVVYVSITMTVQSRIGGRNRLKTLQEEMKGVQLRLMEAGKSRDAAASDAVMKEYWQLTGELMKIQFQMFGLLIIILFAFMAVFPYLEPGSADDIRAQLFDNGLAVNCDFVAGDGIYSGCFAIPENAKKGAWVADVFLLSAGNETLARNATALYVEGGVPDDVWLQSSAQSGFLDGLLGKTAYHVAVNASAQNATLGQQLALYAAVSPAQLPQGAVIEGVLNSGTFYHLDLPFTIPLINIHRIIGSYGAFLLAAFAVSIAYSIGRAIYNKATGKK